MLWGEGVILGPASSHAACQVSKPMKSVWGAPRRNSCQLSSEARGKKSRCGMSLSVIPVRLRVRVLDRDSVDCLPPACVQAVRMVER